MRELDYYQIGQRIRKYRKLLNLSQEQLSETVEISTTHLSHIETGNTKLSLAVFVDIANALSVQTDELLHDTLPEKSAVVGEISDILESCTLQEACIIKDLIKSTKVSLNKYLTQTPE